MKKPDKKPKRVPGPFDFCTKHKHSFMQSCGCWGKKQRGEKLEDEDNQETNES